MSERAGRYTRSVSGMVGAMAVLLAVLLVYTALHTVLRQPPPNPVQSVDYRQDVRYARQAADFPLLAPASLPRGWKATTVRFTSGDQQAWHLGVLTDKQRYIGLEQSGRPVSDMVSSYVDPAAVRGGTVTVAGHEWTTYTDPGGDLALVRTEGKITTVVVAHDVPRAELNRYVESLR